MRQDRWDPQQYERFRTQRMQPFFDLVALIEPREGMRVIDLGCGTGELTAMLAERLPGATVEGIDTSPAMLSRAAARASERVHFRAGDIAIATGYQDYDLVFSHAALQWVPDNEAVLEAIVRAMKPGAQLAVQVPKNTAHSSHVVANAVAQQAPFRDWLGGFVASIETPSLERCAELLYAHGFRTQVCLEKAYGHELSSSAEVVEWVKGTFLTAYLGRLDEAQQQVFLDAYRTRLLATIGDRAPYFYPFRRMLLWGRKDAAWPGYESSAAR
jgi:trans-aconitate 2-methyltransferase